MAEHPKDISTSYRGQTRTGDDVLRDRENAARKADLEGRIAQGVQPHPAMSEAEDALADLTESYGGSAVVNGDAVVQDAIGAAVQAAGERVTRAQLTPERRAAEEFVNVLEERGVVLGDTHFHGDDAEPVEEGSPYDTQRLEMELELSGDDEELGQDALGRQIYLDRETGEEYVLS